MAWYLLGVSLVVLNFFIAGVMLHQGKVPQALLSLFVAVFVLKVLPPCPYSKRRKE